MEIPHLGPVTKDKEFGWYVSEPIPVKMLDGAECVFIVEDYDDDPAQEDFHTAIANLLAAGPEALKAVENELFQYYKDADMRYLDEEEEDEDLQIELPEEVWDLISLGDSFHIRRRPYGDQGIYASFTCGCDWEVEHGLDIVLKNGERVNKIGPYDGHVTNSDAFGDESLEDVIYRSVGQ